MNDVQTFAKPPASEDSCIGDTMSIAPDLSATSRFSEGERFAYLHDFA